MIPFLLWMIAGAILFMVYGSQAIFAQVNGHHTHFWDLVMPVATYLGNGVVIVPVLLGVMMLFKSSRDWWYVLTAAACNVVPAFVIQMLKAYFNKPRPFKYYIEDSGWIHFEDFWGTRLTDHSFPSGHSAGVFSMCCFLSMILPKRYQWIGALLFCIALFVGYTRMYLAAHFYRDVYVGSIIGTTVTIFCFALMRQWSKRSFEITRTNNDD